MRQLLIALLFVSTLVPAAASATPEEISASTFRGLELRNLGPALTSGRVVDLAVHPDDTRTWYVAVAAGGVWKTTNAGTTWTPIFDGEGSYSVGCVTLDPNNPHVVWVGTGENNSQRSVGYGDGVYKSLDGGKSWSHMGLKTSEHIGMIRVDPRDSDVVYVASQGPLWSAGGERGLYKTTDGGSTWTAVLEISEHTGVSEVHLDPRDPDTLYAVAYQRGRRVWGLLNGGPESGLYKSADGGETWREINTGLPSVDLGRIGMAISPVNPDIVYAIVEAARDKGGFFRSNDRGETWEKRSSYVSGSPQYYQEIFADPQDVDRIYSMDVWMQISEDGGASWSQVGETYKHVDNHALWINPEQTDHLIAGCDGGIYETFDRGATWRFFANLPITQFYKIAVDNAEPFYNVYGGTQDNFTLGGPTQTVSNHGIVNADWYVTVGGDGFQTRVDPENPDLVYSQWQHGNLVRFDRRTGETLDIQPRPEAGEAPRWNWDAPLIISPHNSQRLYFASQRVYRSDDRGQSWRAVSEDLSRQIDRSELEILGRVWEVDSVSRNRSTSLYGNVVSLTESPLAEGLLYAGSDDGLVQVSEDGGDTWRQIESFPGVPENTYVNDLVASSHVADVVYAAFNNHKRGDFAPYLLKSSDRGQTWMPIQGDLPERGSVYTMVEDPEVPGLLFAGTEFGVFFRLAGGQGEEAEGGQWIELTGGMPTIAVRDLEIQAREVDLVVGTFGRGFYVLDDYSPLRQVDAERLSEEAILFPVRAPKIFMESFTLGVRGKSMQGDAFYSAPNPPRGAVFTYYLAESYETRRDQRWAAEKEAREAEERVEIPSWDELRAEAREEAPEIVLSVYDADGERIRRIVAPAKKGFHRVSWDLRFAAPNPTSLEPWRGHAFSSPPVGPVVVPGTYKVEMARREGGVETPLGEAQSFTVAPLGQSTLPTRDWQALHAFQRRTARLQRAVLGASQVVGETSERLALIKKAIDDAGADAELGQRVRELEGRLADLRLELRGDRVKQRYAEPTAPSIASRVNRVVDGHWQTTADPTATHQQEYERAAAAFGPWLKKLTELVEEDLEALEEDLEAVEAPWTPGRVPRWSMD